MGLLIGDLWLLELKLSPTVIGPPRKAWEA